MAIDILNGKIRLYNYDLSPVGFPSQHNKDGVFIRGREDEEDYIVERASFDDVESENTKSDLFKVGRIRFHPDEEDEIYQRLGIEDRENIKSDEELITLLKDESIKNIKYISNLKSATLLFRMKSFLFNMERNGNIPPHNISSAVIERCNELKYGGKRSPKSEINRILEADKKKNEEENAKKDYNRLAEKVQKLEEESVDKDKTIADSQTAIQDLLKMVDGLKKEDKTSKTTNNKPVQNTTVKKKPGRPKKTS